MLKKMFSLSRPVWEFVSLIFYIIFFGYAIKLIIDAPDLSSKLLYGLFLLGIGLCAAWFEGTKFILNRAIKQTIIYCDEEEADRYLRFLEKFSHLHPYSGSACVLRLMLALDHARYDEAARLAEQNAAGLLAENAELKLISRHTRFIAYGELGETARSVELYHDVCNLKFIRVNNKVQAMAPYYSWDEIDAAYYYYNGKYHKALRAIEKVSDHSMNPREKMNYHYLYARAYHGDGDLKRALEEMDLAIEYTIRNLDRRALLETERAEWATENK